MIHPLFKTLATQPELLAEHAGAYAELAAVEVAGLGARLRRQALLVGVALLAASVALGMLGVAVMLAAVIPVSQMPAPVLLWSVPALPALLAAGCVFALRASGNGDSFATLKQQWAADRELWRAVTREQAQ
jgi:uncharacterized membrane protein YqjE